jgi:hypothetical protein
MKLLALLALSTLLASPALAQGCRSPGAVEASLREQVPTLDRPVVYTGADAAVLLAAFNAQPPPSEYQADQVIGAILPDGEQSPAAFMGLFLAGCYQDGAAVGWAYLKDLLAESAS